MDVFSEILGLPIRELRDRIERELLENPVFDSEGFGPAVGAVADPFTILQLPIQTLCNRIKEELSDVVVNGLKAGVPEVRVQDELARFSVSQYYSEMHRDPATDPPTRELLGRLIKQAQQLLEALKRRRTILKEIGNAIFRQQMAFLEYGPDHIVPLNAETVGREIGILTPVLLEEVKDKQVRTPHGTFSLDSFLALRPRPLDY